MINLVRSVVKWLLPRESVAFRGAQYLYHETRFAYSRLWFRINWPAVKVVRFSADELARAHQAGFRSQFGQDLFLAGSALDGATSPLK